jgi:ABC-2 type transport system ATP-binding protein
MGLSKYIESARGERKLLEISKLIKNYGKKEAVKEVSLRVAKGEIYGFLGPNGAGKSTTIKACTGLLKPTSGFIRIGDYDIATNPIEAKMNFGYVPENPYLYNKLTGREFIEVLADVYVNDKSRRIKERMNWLLEEFQMIKDVDKLIGTYSQGMRKKITICAALMHSPAVVLLDEPTNGLDAASARIAKDLFRKCADEGSSILFTSHVLEIAEKLCDRVGMISHGELLVEGTLVELREFIGDSDSSLEDIFLRVTTSCKEI